MINEKDKEILDEYAMGVRRTYEYCAEDILVDDKGKLDESKIMTRDAIWDVAHDLFFGGHYEQVNVSRKIVDFWWLMTEEEKEYVKMKAFPDSIYGY